MLLSNADLKKQTFCFDKSIKLDQQQNDLVSKIKQSLDIA